MPWPNPTSPVDFGDPSRPALGRWLVLLGALPNLVLRLESHTEVELICRIAHEVLGGFNIWLVYG